MGHKIDRIAQGLLRPVNPYGSLILGTLTWAWGLWVLLPWSVFETAPLFSVMKTFAPEWAWGSWATATGVLIVGAVQRGLYKWLYRALAFATWHWSTVATFMWWGDWHNTGGLTYSFIAFYCIYLYLNIKHNFDKTGENTPNFYS